MNHERHRTLRRVVTNGALALGLMSGALGTAAAQTCTVSTNRTSITFKTLPSGSGIKILSLTDLVTGGTLQVGGSAIWQVVFAANPTFPGLPTGHWDEQRVPPAAPVSAVCDSNNIYRRGYPIQRPVATNGVSVVQAGAGCVLTWNDVALPTPVGAQCGGSPGHFDVVVRVQPKTIGGRQFLSWTAEVTMADDACDYWRVLNVKLPLFALREIGDVGADDHVAFPTNHGIVVDDPITNRQPYPEEALSGDPLLPENDRIARRFTYPARVQAQYMAYYDDTPAGEGESDEDEIGLWIGADDVSGFVKRLYFGTIEPSEKSSDAFLQMHLTHLNGGESLEEFKTFDLSALRTATGAPTGYDVIMTTYQGDWWDAAVLYREWLEARQPPFLSNGKLHDQVENGTETDRARVELGAGVVSRHDDSGTIARANPNDPDSEFSKLRSWSEFYRRVNDPSAEPLECLELAANFNNFGNLLSLDAFCNDELVTQTSVQSGVDMIRQLRVPVTATCGVDSQQVPPLFRWSIANSDAGNYNSRVSPFNCQPSFWTSFALPMYWNGTFVDDPVTTPLKSFTSSGSDWLTNCVRIWRWPQFMLITNASPSTPYVPTLCPSIGPCSLPVTIPTPPNFRVDWKGFNAIAFTGDGPVSFPSYAPLHSSGHTHRGTTQSGGGTYWVDNYLEFLRGTKNTLFTLSTTIPTPFSAPIPQPDLAGMIAGTERAHEWLISEASWFGKNRTVPFDTAQRGPIDWIASKGARLVPFLSMVYHDYVTMGGHLLERSELLKLYGTADLGSINTSSPVQMESLRARSDAAQVVLGGWFPSLSMSTDLSAQYVPAPGQSPVTFSPILFDGPPDPSFTCPTPNPVSWIGSASALQADYDYYRDLFALRPLHKEHLIYGRRFRDPVVEPRTPECLTTFQKRFIRPEYDPASSACVDFQAEFFYDMVHVVGSTFTSPSGTPAFFFTNYYRTDLGVCSGTPDYGFRFSFDPTELGLSDGTYKLWRVERDGCADSGTCTEETALGTFTVTGGQAAVFTSGYLTLPPGESVVLHASPTSPCAP